MMARTPEGENVRDYFIEVEKIAKENKPQTQLSTLDMIELGLKQMRDHNKRLIGVERDVKELKAATNTTPGYFAIMANGNKGADSTPWKPHFISFHFGN